MSACNKRREAPERISACLFYVACIDGMSAYSPDMAVEARVNAGNACMPPVFARPHHRSQLHGAR